MIEVTDQPISQEVSIGSFVLTNGVLSVTLSDGSTVTEGFQYSTDLQTWSTEAVDLTTAPSVFVRLGEPLK